MGSRGEGCTKWGMEGNEANGGRGEGGIGQICRVWLMVDYKEEVKICTQILYTRPASGLWEMDVTVGGMGHGERERKKRKRRE